MDDAIFKQMGVMMSVIMLAAVLQMVLPSGDASGSTEQYCCPICGACFDTLAELEQHFAAEHPTEPINIGWN